jgi:diketogulonate reductase-like aldo/keto reductase
MADILASGVNGGIPPLLYGTAWKKGDTASLVETAIRAGFRGIDTAGQPKHYDEGGVGQAVAACLRDDRTSSGRLTRAELYLQTKFTPLSAQDPTRIPYDPAASLPEQVRQSFAASLGNLQTNYWMACSCIHLFRPPHRCCKCGRQWSRSSTQVA